MNSIIDKIKITSSNTELKELLEGTLAQLNITGSTNEKSSAMNMMISLQVAKANESKMDNIQNISKAIAILREMINGRPF